MKIKSIKQVNNLKGKPLKLVKKIVANLTNEFNLYYDNIEDDLFVVNERSFVGLVNNAIVRNDSDRFITLLEYSTKNEKTKENGRGDLFLYDVKQKGYFIFEFKHNTTSDKVDDKWDDSRTENYLKETLYQADKYYKADKPFFKNKHVYTCALIFDTVKTSRPVCDLYRKGDSKIEDYFWYTLYKENENYILNIYGIIKEK